MDAELSRKTVRDLRKSSGNPRVIGILTENLPKDNASPDGPQQATAVNDVTHAAHLAYLVLRRSLSLAEIRSVVAGMVGA